MHYLKQSQRDVKKNNLNLILNTIIKHEPLSRADIVRITKISKPTVSNLIDYLLQREIINEIGIGESKGGRKPILISFNNLRKYIVATDLGREDCTVAISDLKGNILDKANEKFKKQDRLNDKLGIAKDLIHLLINNLKIEPSLIFKISCIAPGVYAERGKELKWSPVNTQNEGADIKNYFESEYHVPVIINHSTKLSLLGEKVAGKAKDYKNVLYIDFAYGLGCSFMIDGNIYFGMNNSAGELGYFYSSLQKFLNKISLKEDFYKIKKLKDCYEIGFEYEKNYRGCAQCLISTIFKFTGKNNNSLFQSASGLSGGMALCGDGACGGYSGGIMIMGSFIGRRFEMLEVNGDKEAQSQAYQMAQRLHDKFIETYGSVICADIHKQIFGKSFCLRSKEVRKEFEEAGAHLDKCTTVVAMAASWVADILSDEGFL
jgi:C_GCAxxG_C_C family probable redox protein